MLKTVLLLLIGCAGVHSQIMTAHFIAVGHGDATFLEFPEGRTMLVDGGDEDAGRLVVNYIEDLGYKRVDYVVLTHSHPDHIGGLIRVLKELDVGEVWESPYMENNELTQKFDAVIISKNINIKTVSRGEINNIGSVEILALNPPRGNTMERLLGPNGASVVMMFKYGTNKLLLAADIPIDIDENVTRIYKNRLKSDVLKCAHHGSALSNSDEFLSAVLPEVAVVSTGPSEWGYPSRTTMARIKSHASKVYRTDLEGNIVIKFDGSDYRVMLEE